VSIIQVLYCNRRVIRLRMNSDKAVSLLTYIGGAWLKSSLGHRLSVLTEVYRWLVSLFFQANATRASQLGHDHFFPNISNLFTSNLVTIIYLVV
jgi:hypothetical protein